MTNFAQRYNELEMLSKEWNCSIAEVAREAVIEFYQENFPEEMILDEFPTDDAIIEHYYNNFEA